MFLCTWESENMDIFSKLQTNFIYNWSLDPDNIFNWNGETIVNNEFDTLFKKKDMNESLVSSKSLIDNC